MKTNADIESASVRLAAGLLRGPASGRTAAGALLVDRGLAEYIGDVLWLLDGMRSATESFVALNTINPKS
jgi:hypothetical protein